MLYSRLHREVPQVCGSTQRDSKRQHKDGASRLSLVLEEKTDDVRTAREATGWRLLQEGLYETLDSELTF